MERNPSPAGEPFVSQWIKVEANLLRLPLFAIHTKGLSTLDGIQCRGKTNRDGVAKDYLLSSTRNTATLYPGPLARSVHMAMLSLVTDAGFPFENPITWTWRDLCRRMGITYSGRTALQLKAAILSTQGLLIRSQDALYSKSERKLLRTNDRSVSLYEKVTFSSDAHAEAGHAEANRVWLSGWYLENINSFFTAPLDYGLWRHLDARSTIASRLYEFLLLNFYGDNPVLRINYKNLTQFLPVKTERYASDAKKQLGPALEHLRVAGVVEKTVWSTGKDGGSQLHIHRGPRMSTARTPQRHQDEVLEEMPVAMEVAELRNQKPPEWGVVVDFYRDWTGGDDHRPSAKELQQAKELVQEHGVTRAKTLVQLAARRMKIGWPEAKSFAALTKYLPDARKDLDRDKQTKEAERREQSRKQLERDEQEQQKAEWHQFEATWAPRWEQLTEPERCEVRQSVLKRRPYLEKSPRMLQSMCLEEMAGRPIGG